MKPRIRKCYVAPHVYECRIGWFLPVGHGYTPEKAFEDWKEQVEAAQWMFLHPCA